MYSIEGQGLSDDDVGNEDLSLEIVQMAIERASQAAAAGVDTRASHLLVGEDVDTKNVKKKKTTKVKKKKAKKIATETDTKSGTATIMMEEQPVNLTEDADVVNISGAGDNDNNSDNIILRRLLRGPRYFDPPNKSWGACFNCGEEGHSADNCTSAKRKKPCFICGSLEHEAKQCQKDCFICKGGHRAKDCPKKYKRGSLGTELCLKCGASAHSMSSCNNDYPTGDLKEVQCYVCKRFGHLCCADYSDALPSEVSCYKCGLLGHNGQVMDSSPAACPFNFTPAHFGKISTPELKLKLIAQELKENFQILHRPCKVQKLLASCIYIIPL